MGRQEEYPFQGQYLPIHPLRRFNINMSPFSSLVPCAEADLRSESGMTMTIKLENSRIQLEIRQGAITLLNRCFGLLRTLNVGQYKPKIVHDAMDALLRYDWPSGQKVTSPMQERVQIRFPTKEERNRFLHLAQPYFSISTPATSGRQEKPGVVKSISDSQPNKRLNPKSYNQSSTQSLQQSRTQTQSPSQVQTQSQSQVQSQSQAHIQGQSQDHTHAESQTWSQLQSQAQSQLSSSTLPTYSSPPIRPPHPSQTQIWRGQPWVSQEIPPPPMYQTGPHSRYPTQPPYSSDPYSYSHLTHFPPFPYLYPHAPAPYLPPHPNNANYLTERSELTVTQPNGPNQSCRREETRNDHTDRPTLQGNVATVGEEVQQIEESQEGTERRIYDLDQAKLEQLVLDVILERGFEELVSISFYF
ncbi:hypothetical protein TREMEDRAFT_58866 [Tremella mesenterica DSM 1558]|uniref:uncharacterized protein n=1 Tax=Tremella mesenterica (strain ATCC 24925 / CBS 8224 / DSM 1558 / NBRC 9311 / NRRL Y-6157 / RJB 2259-6 / UBC 559-6) TaxID=578456 RepID=UPI0003F49902|nr:uncharacterized protein TREMEDRAFT_58866 [Tremella mesenterica DSM 1558]EIW72698.1 hypothetical protein TREMEDRAFT_58866 [Tremella mesenterica DSM 1558]